eukprot:364533-Chlamydomonas_euryale.AAC.12
MSVSHCTPPCTYRRGFRQCVHQIPSNQCSSVEFTKWLATYKLVAEQCTRLEGAYVRATKSCYLLHFAVNMHDGWHHQIQSVANERSAAAGKPSIFASTIYRNSYTCNRSMEQWKKIK